MKTQTRDCLLFGIGSFILSLITSWNSRYMLLRLFVIAIAALASAILVEKTANE